MTKSELRALASSAVASHAVTRVAMGEGLNLAPHQWRDLARAPRVDAERLSSEYISERRMEVARDAAFTGDHEFAREVASGQWDHSL